MAHPPRKQRAAKELQAHQPQQHCFQRQQIKHKQARRDCCQCRTRRGGGIFPKSVRPHSPNPARPLVRRPPHHRVTVEERDHRAAVVVLCAVLLPKRDCLADDWRTGMPGQLDTARVARGRRLLVGGRCRQLGRAVPRVEGRACNAPGERGPGQ